MGTFAESMQGSPTPHERPSRTPSEAHRPGERMRAGEAAIDRNRLSINVRGIVAGEEQRHGGNLARHTVASERVELPDLALGATIPGTLEDRAGHSGFDEARADRVD